jgi:UDP-galactopyranose mutase
MTQISDFPLVIVGSGFFGATVAYEIASKHNLPVLVIDRRDHIGGNAYSKVDDATGIEYHVYGSHIFHTSSETVWTFLRQFTEFNNYRHRVITRHNGRVYSMPINLATINTFFETDFSPNEAAAFLAEEIARDHIASPANLEEKAISLIGRKLYEAFIRGYTKKQWETDPRLLPADIITRLPFRLNYNDFYFADKYEGIPLHGYTKIFESMLAHPNITTRTNCDYFAVKNQIAPTAATIYTGAIDAYFNDSLGKLGWRTLDLELERPAMADYQGTSVMNYADTDTTFTRIHEFRHYHPERTHTDQSTLIMREYSRFAGPTDEPYYPINTPADKTLYDQYKALATTTPQTVFGGRLGTYRYLDMHQAIGAALKSVDSEVIPLLQTLGHL